MISFCLTVGLEKRGREEYIYSFFFLVAIHVITQNLMLALDAAECLTRSTYDPLILEK